jgi:hypothetical protein
MGLVAIGRRLPIIGNQPAQNTDSRFRPTKRFMWHQLCLSKFVIRWRVMPVSPQFVFAMYPLTIGRCSACPEQAAFAEELADLLLDHPDLDISLSETHNDDFWVEVNGKIVAEKNGIALPSLSEIVDAVLDEVPMLV